MENGVIVEVDGIIDAIEVVGPLASLPSILLFGVLVTLGTRGCS